MEFLSQCREARQLSAERRRLPFSFPSRSTVADFVENLKRPSPRELPAIALGQRAAPAASSVRFAETVITSKPPSHEGSSTVYPINAASAEDARSWIGDCKT